MKSISDSYKDDYDDEMLTTTTTVNAQKRQPIGKWSGSDEPQSYYEHEDTDTVTLSRHEVNYIRWYQSRDHSKWRNDDDE